MENQQSESAKIDQDAKKPNALLEQVKSQVLAQAKARVEKVGEQDAKHAFVCKP